MSIYGYLCCRDCKQEVFLGKWLRSDHDEKGFGFWHGSLGNQAEGPLGTKALVFIARHLEHDVRAYVEGSELDEANTDYSKDEDDELTSLLAKPK